MMWNIIFPQSFLDEIMQGLPLNRLIHEFTIRHIDIAPATQSEQRLQLDLCQELGQHWKIPSTAPTQHALPQQSHFKEGELCSYYQLAMMLFPQITSASPLDIDFMDTLFFLPDHTVCYVYKDSRKGLIRMKQRGINICQVFIKRKNRNHHRERSRLTFNKPLTQTSFPSQNEQSTSSWGGLGYAALLKYKDESFMMLKEADFRAIFTNPLYANQRFRHNNTAQYIQSLADEDTQESRVNFSWSNFRDQPLLNLAEECILGNISASHRNAIRRKLSSMNAAVYLHYCVFEVVAYVAVNYNKQVNKGVFHFVKQNQTWTMSYVQAITISTYSRSKFTHADLWANTSDNFAEFKEEGENAMFHLENEVKSKLLKEVEKQFTMNNLRIKQDVSKFIQKKLDTQAKYKDKMLSASIFKLLHPHSKHNLHQVLEHPQNLAKVISPPAPSPKVKFIPVKPSFVRKPKCVRGQKSSKNISLVYRGLDSSQA